MNICVIFEFSFKPELLAHIERRLAENIPDTRNWKGCLGFDVYRDPTTPSDIVFVERWDSRKNYEEYDAWRVETGAFAEFSANCTRPPARRFLDLTTI